MPIITKPAIVHLRMMVNDETGDVLPLCRGRMVTKETSSSWMNNVTCEVCRDRWHETTGVPRTNDS